MSLRLSACFFFVITAGISPLFAQITGPEQDCDFAIPVCQDVYVQDTTYQGVGLVNDLAEGSSCLGEEENNSVWYIFTVAASGMLEFDIGIYGASASDTVDYDFSLFNITGASCADIYNGGHEVRCNFSFTDTVTGLRAGYTSNTVSVANGPHFCAPLAVTTGETYVLLVDNFNTALTGYVLDFTASTAVIRDTVPPEIINIDTLGCVAADSITIYFSEPIKCNSLSSSDFLVAGPSAVNVAGVFSASCAAGGDFTQDAVVNFSAPVAVSGNYSLSLVQGTDGNTVVDNCDNRAVPVVHSFYVPERVTAGFTVIKLASCVADTFVFTNTTTGNAAFYQWDFGDSGTSSLANPTHVYPVVDTYSVTLIAASNDCVDTVANNSIIATNTLDVIIAYNPPDPCVGLAVNFTDSSGYTPSAARLWEFGDGNFSIDVNASHIYSSPGTYQVKLKITDASCPPDSTFETIQVRENVNAVFTYSDTVCQGIETDFTDASTGAPMLWTWTFPDGSMVNSQNAAFVFDSAGNYTVRLDVQDTYCGTDSAIESVEVLPRPIFDLGPEIAICFSETAELTVVSNPPAESYSWSTGETTQSIMVSIVPDTVSAVAFLNGCFFTDSKIIREQIEECSFALVPSGFSPNGDGKNDFLRVLTKRVSEYEIIIYNRWGEEIYRETNDDASGWDGSYKDDPLDIGVFAYVITYTSLRGGPPVTQSGTITLIR